jgi:hypothetical protein
MKEERGISLLIPSYIFPNQSSLSQIKNSFMKKLRAD